MPVTIKKHIIDKYLQLVTPLYAEPKIENILGSFLTKPNAPTTNRDVIKTPAPKKKAKPNRDIWMMFNSF